MLTQVLRYPLGLKTSLKNILLTVLAVLLFWSCSALAKEAAWFAVFFVLGTSICFRIIRNLVGIQFLSQTVIVVILAALIALPAEFGTMWLIVKAGASLVLLLLMNRNKAPHGTVFKSN